MKVGLLGYGTVGSGVLEQLQARSDISVKRVLDIRPIPALGSLQVFDIAAILDDPEIDVVVELIGGMHPAYDFVLSALQHKKHVVTANKFMLSYHLPELLKVAHENGVQLRYDASVGGGIPYLHNMARALRGDELLNVFGIVNGTTNLILDSMQTTGADFAEVLAQAQKAGYAEANPSADIDGIDARSKVCIASMFAFGRAINPEEIAVAPLRTITGADVRKFKKLGYVCRYLVYGERAGDAVSACVEPVLVKPESSEAAVATNNNLIGFTGRYAGVQTFYGQGAGKDPTALSVVQGLIDLNTGVGMASPDLSGEPAAVDNSRLVRRYYLRTTAPVALEAESLGDGAYLTQPVPVPEMHALAAKLRAEDPNLFFCSVREE